MNEIATVAFVRKDIVPERPAPVKTTGLVGFLRTRLFNSPTNILITIVSALLLWLIVVPSLKFLFVDAVWSGKDRTACLAEAAGHTGGPAGRSSRRNSASSSTASIPSRSGGGSI